MKPWQRQVIADAADQRDASYAALARWAGVHVDTLRKARKREPEFDQAITDARAGAVRSGEVVDIETFVRDPDYLGLGVRGQDDGGTIYPRVLDHLKAINSGAYSLGIMTGGIGSAKSMTSVISLIYSLYVLLSQDDPHASLKLDPASPILIVLQNRNEKLSKLNAYSLFRNLIEQSPWFQQHQPHDDRLKSRIKFLKRNVEVWPVGGDAESVLGMNVFGALLDEGNFYDITAKSKRSVTDDRVFDQARESFEGLIRRKLSRLDEDKGLVFVSSSRRYRGEFTGQLTDEFGSDPRTYLFDETCWSINPEAYADGSWFHVFQGDQTRPPRILSDDEDVHPADRDLIVRVPSKFRRQFKTNITRSLQDLAGCSLERVGTYFTDREALTTAACLPNRLMAASEVVGDAMLLFPGLVDLSCPDSPRAVHGDLSLSGDATGLCIAHIRAYDNQGRPLIDVDGLARIAPPRHGQISIDSVAQLVAAWKAHGVKILWFSADGFQSADLLQRLQRLGIRAGRLSVDMTSPSDPCGAFEALRLAVVEGRIRFAHDPVVVEELLALEHDRKRNRIDHPPGGAKDSADALAGAVYQLSRIPAWQLIDRVPNAGYAAATAHTLGGQVTVIPNLGPGRGYMDLIRQQMGMPARH